MKYLTSSNNNNNNDNATGDPRETTYLFQRLSICTLRYNAVAFKGSFEQRTTDENLNLMQ